MKKSNVVLLITLLLLALLAVLLWRCWDQVDESADDNVQPPSAVVNNFEECESAGYGITESYPRQCQTPDGRTFVEDIGNELDKADLIRLDTPRPNDTVGSPLSIAGEARGKWFFEASFPIKIYDAAGKELGTAIAQAQSNWMTDDFVPFEATIEFQAPRSGKGTLVLNRDNPSGLKENEDSLIVPIRFGESSQTEQVSLFYYDLSKDRDATGNVKCSPDGLVEVKRNIAKSSTIISDTIKLLLTGKLTAEEKNAGISTEFPLPGLELLGAQLDADGVLTLTFADPGNRTSGGSCRAGVLWDQIEATARQFTEVKTVKFLPESVFQP